MWGEGFASPTVTSFRSCAGLRCDALRCWCGRGFRFLDYPIENLSNIYRTSIENPSDENLSNIYRKSIENLGTNQRTSAERSCEHLYIHREYIEHQSNRTSEEKINESANETLSSIHRNAIEHLSTIYRTSI